MGDIYVTALEPIFRGEEPDVSKIHPLFRSLMVLLFALQLYAFWSWCSVVWESYIETQDNLSWDANAVTFGVLAIGGAGCVIGGLLSEKYGSAMVAFGSLTVSGLLCLLSPALYLAPPAVMLTFYLIWGLAVVADSPQFSSLVATTAPAANKGTALTIVNCVGFSITIGSIQLLSVSLSEQYLFLLLAPGPIFGLWSMRSLAFPERFAAAGDSNTTVLAKGGSIDVSVPVAGETIGNEVSGENEANTTEEDLP